MGLVKTEVQLIVNFLNIVTQDQSVFITSVFHNFSDYDCHLIFKKWVDKKINKLKFKIIPKANEKYISVRYGCIRSIDSYRFLSSSLDSIVQTLIGNNHKTLENLREELVDNDEFLVIVNEIKLLIKEDSYNNDSIKDLKKDYSVKYEKLEEALINYKGKNDLEFLKTTFADNKWKYLIKK